jgi:hypothetical protein
MAGGRALPAGWFPVVREQLVDACGRVGLHAHDHVLDVIECVDAVALRRLDEGVEDGEVTRCLLVTEEERVFWLSDTFSGSARSESAASGGVIHEVAA